MNNDTKMTVESVDRFFKEKTPDTFVLQPSATDMAILSHVAGAKPWSGDGRQRPSDDQKKHAKKLRKIAKASRKRNR